MYKPLFDEFLTSGKTLQVYEGGKLIFTSNKDGLLPFVEYLEKFASDHRNVVIFDKIMGHAAALLCIKANCREVYSPLGSQLAVEVLEKYGVKYHLTEIVPYIQKPNQKDMCPMENLSLDKEPEEFYRLIKNLLAETPAKVIKEVNRKMKKSSPEVVYKELLKGKTMALVIEHELRGVTPDMLDWWWDNMDNDTYRLWHPQDHVALEWQIPPSEVGHAGAIHMACESISDVPAHILRIRWEEPSAAPIATIYSHVNVGSALAAGADDIPLGSAVHEYEETSYGTQMRSTFILPAVVPQQFLDSLRQHNIAEMGRFPEFLPQLFKQKTAAEAK